MVDDDAQASVSEDAVLDRRRNMRGSYYSFKEFAKQVFLVGVVVVVLFCI